MPDFTSIAKTILKKQEKYIDHVSIDKMVIELKKSLKGRKIQILILLDKQDRLTALEITNLTGIDQHNLSLYTLRMERNFLIEIYDGSKFMDPSKVNYRFRYHSNTDVGRELIADLGK